MRKLLTMMSIAIIIIMTIVMTIPAFAATEITAKTDYTNPEFYTVDVDQQVHIAGASSVVSGDLNWDETTTPKGAAALVEGIKPVVVSKKYIAGATAGGAQTTTTGGAYYSNAPIESEDSYKMPDLEYYVVEDSNSIYVTARVMGNSWGSNYVKRFNYYLRLGFNPSNYGQALIVNWLMGTDGVGSTKWGAFFHDSLDTVANTPAEYSCITKANFQSYGYNSTTKVEDTAAYKSANEPHYKNFAAYLTVELDKKALAKDWDAAFGTDFYNDNGTTDTTEDDTYNLPNTIFAVTACNTQGMTDNGTQLHITLGAESLNEQRNLVNNVWGTRCVLLPDVIVLGDEREGICSDGTTACTFGKNVDDAFKITNDDGTYYYYTSCATCNTVGYNKFTTCELNAVEGVLAHTWKDIGKKDPTCLAPGYTAHKWCEVCGEEDGKTVLPITRWTTGAKSAADYTSLQSYGQQIHVAGASSVVSGDLNWTPDRTAKTQLKGVLDIAPTVTALKTTNKYMASSGIAEYQSTNNENDEYNNEPLSTATESDLEKVPDLEYYVVEDDNSVYITFRILENPWDGGYIKTSGHNFWIGFNSADYSQAVNLRWNVGKIDTPVIVGFNDAQNGMLKTASGNDWLVQSLFSRYNFANGVEAKNCNSHYNYNNSVNPWVKYISFEIDKEKMAYYWDELYDTNFVANGLPNTIFLATSSYVEATSDSTGAFFYTNGATSLDKELVNGWGTNCVFLPDVIVLGDEKEIGCDFAKTVTDDHKITNEDGTYYYFTSCTVCNSRGAATFTACDISGQHTFPEDTSTDTRFNVPARAATCIAPGYTAHKRCTVCGEKNSDYVVTEPLRYVGGEVPPNDYTSLASLGQQYLVAGSNAILPNEFTWDDLGEKGINGLVKVVSTNKYVANTYAGGIQTTTNSGGYYNNAPIVDQGQVSDLPNLEYYVGENESKLYMTFRFLGTPLYSHATTGYFFRLGIDPTNYSRTAVITCDMNGTNLRIVGYNNDASSSWVGEVSKGAPSDWLTNSSYARYAFDGFNDGKLLGNAHEACAYQAVTYMSVEIDKAKLAAAWDEMFGTDFYTDDSNYKFSNTLFMASSFMAMVNGVEVPVTYGASSITKDQATALQRKSIFLPDIIVLGEDKDFGCNFTAHRYVIDGDEDTAEYAKYLVKETNGVKIYSHSCVDCGAIGATTFKVSDGKIVYDVKNSSEATEVVAPTCESEGTYIYSCTCKAIDTDTTNTYNVEALGHDEDSAEYIVLGNEHFMVCKNCKVDDTTLPEGGKKYEHVYGQAVILPDGDGDQIPDNRANDSSFVPVCTEGYSYYYACECGEFTTDEKFEDETSRNTENHDFGDPQVYVSDDSVGHYYECVRCQAISDFSVHVFDDENDTECDECGYIVEEDSWSGIGGGSVGGDTTDTTDTPDTEAPTPDTDDPEDTGSVDTGSAGVGDDTTEEESTDAPETEAPTDSESESEQGSDTEAPADSCGGTVSFAGLAIVAALGTCAVFATKKKDEE